MSYHISTCPLPSTYGQSWCKANNSGKNEWDMPTPCTCEIITYYSSCVNQWKTKDGIHSVLQWLNHENSTVYHLLYSRSKTGYSNRPVGMPRTISQLIYKTSLVWEDKSSYSYYKPQLMRDQVILRWSNTQVSEHYYITKDSYKTNSATNLWNQNNRFCYQNISLP